MHYRTRLLTLAAAVLLFCGFSLPSWPEIQRRAAESLLNTVLRDYFAGTLQVEQARIDRNLHLHLAGLKGELVTRERPVAIQLQRIDSQDPLYRMLFLKPVSFDFQGLKPASSLLPGVSGRATATPGWKWAFELRADVERLGLEDIIWVNPDSLAGSSGQMQGWLEVKTDYTGHSEFTMELKVPEPGGSLQARFFEAVTPYLPKQAAGKKVSSLAQTHETIGYKHASLTAQLENDDQVKMLLRILVPDYNLNLNLNLLIKVDEKNAFSKLFELMGILQGQNS